MYCLTEPAMMPTRVLTFGLLPNVCLRTVNVSLNTNINICAYVKAYRGKQNILKLSLKVRKYTECPEHHLDMSKVNSACTSNYCIFAVSPSKPLTPEDKQLFGNAPNNSHTGNKLSFMARDKYKFCNKYSHT